MKGLHLFTDLDQDLQSLQPLPEFKEEWQPFSCGVGLDDQFHNLTTLFPQFTPQDVFTVTTEVPHYLLKIDSEIHGLLVNRQMLVSRHL